MVGHELAIEQREPGEFQPRDEVSERDLRRVGRAADHRFAEKRSAQRHPVKSADQIFIAPAFDAVRMTVGM